MKVVNPNNSNHSIVLIPRLYAYTSLQMELYNEFTQAKEIITITHSLVDGLLTINFTKAFQEGQTFQIKVTDNAEVVYRGKLLATSQDTQTFKASKDLYYHE